jgi:hypothetical protein
MERRDWERIKAIKPAKRVISHKVTADGKVEIKEANHSKAANGGAGRGRAARDKRASRKLRNIRARSKKRA